MDKKIVFSVLVFIVLVASTVSAYYCESKRENPDLIPYYGSPLHIKILENNPRQVVEFIKYARHPVGRIFLTSYIKQVKSCSSREEFAGFARRLNKIPKILR